MPDSIKPGLSKHSGKIVGGLGLSGLIAAAAITVINYYADTGPTRRDVRPDLRRDNIQKIAQLDSTNATQDILIQHNKEAIAEIKADNREIKREIKKGNREVIQAINDMKGEVGQLKARLEFNR